MKWITYTGETESLPPDGTDCIAERWDLRGTIYRKHPFGPAIANGIRGKFLTLKPGDMLLPIPTPADRAKWEALREAMQKLAILGGGTSEGNRIAQQALAALDAKD